MFTEQEKLLDIEALTRLNEARRRVNDQVLQANTLPEIEAAKQVLRDWLTAHPEESGMRDGFEQLYTIQEIIEDEDARRAGEVILPIGSERERVLDQVLDARTLPEIAAAEHSLRDWLRRNPTDTGIREAFEGLSLMLDIAEEQGAERTETSHQPVVAGQAA